MTGFFSDRKRRNIAVLGALAAISLLAAMLALQHRDAVVAPKSTPQLFFPSLRLHLNEITRIRIASKKGGSFEVVFLPEKGWVLPGRANYPASFEVVKKTLTALAALETIEPKTDRADLYHFVDLDAPPQGGGVDVTVTGEKGRVLAALVVGKSAPLGDDAIGLFVRRAGESQSWLAKSPAEIPAAPSDWMDKTVMNVDRARVAAVEVRPASGPGYGISRAKPSDPGFLMTLPKGRELAYEGAADTAAAAVADFSFDDILPAGEVDFSGAARVVTRTFDGLSVTIDLKKLGEDNWARVFATAEPGKPQAARDAHDINARAAGWAFKLPAYKAAMLAAPLESLLKPKK